MKNRVDADAIETHVTGVFAGLLKHIESWPRYLDLGFAHVDPKSIFFHVSLPEDQLLLQFTLRFTDDDQVICIHVYPCIPCTKLLGWAPRTVMNSMGHSQGPWWTATFTQNFLLATNTHCASGIFIHALYDPHHSSTPSLQRAQLITCLGIQSNAFSRSIKAMHSVLLTVWNFSCNQRTMNIFRQCCVWAWSPEVCVLNRQSEIWKFKLGESWLCIYYIYPKVVHLRDKRWLHDNWTIHMTWKRFPKLCTTASQ